MIRQINRNILKKESINRTIREDIQDSDDIISYVKNAVGRLGEKSVQEKCISLIEREYFVEIFIII